LSSEWKSKDEKKGKGGYVAALRSQILRFFAALRMKAFKGE